MTIDERASRIHRAIMAGILDWEFTYHQRKYRAPIDEGAVFSKAERRDLVNAIKKYLAPAKGAERGLSNNTP